MVEPLMAVTVGLPPLHHGTLSWAHKGGEYKYAQVLAGGGRSPYLVPPPPWAPKRAGHDGGWGDAGAEGRRPLAPRGRQANPLSVSARVVPKNTSLLLGGVFRQPSTQS